MPSPKKGIEIFLEAELTHGGLLKNPRLGHFQEVEEGKDDLIGLGRRSLPKIGKQGPEKGRFRWT